LVDVEITKQALADHGDHIVEPLVDRLMESNKLRCLENPLAKGYVGVHFDKAKNWLVEILPAQL
jgi:hypothetical protein